MAQSDDTSMEELATAINDFVALHDEYASKYVSVVPLGDGPVPIFPFEPMRELSVRVQNAEIRYDDLRKKLWGF